MQQTIRLSLLAVVLMYESSPFGTRVDVAGGRITEIAGQGNGGGRSAL